MSLQKSLGQLGLSLVLVALSLVLLHSCRNGGKPTPPRVLVFSKTKGWKHSSIPFADAAIQKLGKDNGFAVDTTKNAAYFIDDSLKHYHAVVFNNTTRNVLNAEQQAAFERYIQAGGGYVGIHSAADTEYEWPWYGKLMGAFFSSHPHNSNIRAATINVTDKNHISTKGLPDHWERKDEWYNYRSFYPGIKVLAYLDENTYEGGTNGANHPIAWYHEFDGGRAFYTASGHVDSSYTEPLYLEHLLGGIKYAMGNGVLDYRKSYSVVTPEENRFVKTTLVNDLNTPMELAVANDGRIFFTELRSANLSLYNSKTGEYKIVHRFDVCIKGGTGLIGVTLDPNFPKQPYIYLYYSPPTDKEPIIFNLSRFVLKEDNTLDLASEKILLKVPVQENSGSHHGGSLAWDKEENLYLSTGDSSTPFPANGYPPLDERPDKQYYSQDAQRGASNTNDLKGKVLRIHPEPDGTYTIPEGNLFPKGKEKTLPEIYAMGCRNPYRIAVNPKTSVLYWGEIGPDAGKDSVQGPRGYDEFNQAKKAGNYGWPYFVGNNYAYAEWDFAKQTAGPRFDPAKPINNSPNNTGLQELPPAQPAMIWYPYAASKEFPELGQGGRSAMAGSFYTYDKDSSSKNKFPDYYDGALFVFDWMRNWVLALRFDKDENYVRSEPFMSANGDFRRPIDLAFGGDGVMYILEYGSVYGADNDDARLVKIEYNTGNRPPQASARVTDSVAQAELSKKVFLTSELRNLPVIREAVGEIPLRVLFSSAGTSDPDDDDAIRYEWLFDGKTVGSTEANPKYTYTTPGLYTAILRVKDKAGLTDTDTIIVKAGDDRPQVAITSRNNRSFFWPKKLFSYAVKVSDREDGKIDPRAVHVSYEYIPEPVNVDANGKSEGITASGNVPIGYSLIAGSDCKACHTLDKVSVGPSYQAVSQRYIDKPDAVATLTKKIIAGGGGIWGTEHVMAAHPQLDEKDVNEMVKYILSLSRTKKEKSNLPLQGTVALTDSREDEPRGIYRLTAVYTDKGAHGIGPVSQTDVVTLRRAKMKTIYTDAQVGFSRFGNNLTAGDHKAFMLLKNVDLTGIRQVSFEYASDKVGFIEVRLDSQAGPVIGKAAVKSTGGFDKPATTTATFDKPVSGMHNVFFVVVKPEKPNEDIAKINTIEFVE